MQDTFTTRQVAEAITESPLIEGSVYEWQVRRLFEDGDLPEPSRFGGKRVIASAETPRIVEVLRHRGWLPAAIEEEIFDV